MTLSEPPYVLLDLGNHEWRFQESSVLRSASEEFARLMDCASYGPRFSASLRRLLVRHPNHIDALHHYGDCLSMEGAVLERLAFAQMAVATGWRAFPTQFVIERDRLPTGFVQNRPFLRALYGLMQAQRTAGLLEDAITTGQLCLSLDHEDRNEARIPLVHYLAEIGRDKTALELLDRPAYEGTFEVSAYLRDLVLIRLDREDEARISLHRWVTHSPHVARFILNTRLPQPPEEQAVGRTIDKGEYHGWMVARKIGPLWRKSRKGIVILREEFKRHARPA